MDKSILGERIRRRRERMGISQAQLADRVGVRQPTMWRYEAGQMEPRAETLDRIAEELGTTCRELIRGEAEPRPSDPDAAPVSESVQWAAEQAGLDQDGAQRVATVQRLVGAETRGELLRYAELVAQRMKSERSHENG